MNRPAAIDIRVRRAVARRTTRDHLHKLRGQRGLEFAAAELRGMADGIADYLRAVLGRDAAYTVLMEAADDAAFPTTEGAPHCHPPKSVTASTRR